jgi:hypothetical protein
MTLALVAGIGLVAGVLAGLFGVGGGILFVPTLALGLDPRRGGRCDRCRGAAGKRPAQALRRPPDRNCRADRLAGEARIVHTPVMTETDDLWIPLVDEPIGSIVAQVQADQPEIDRLVSSPHKILAFRTFAYIRVGLLLGQLLVDHDVPEYDGTETWIDALLRDPKHAETVAAEVRAVAEEVAADPRYADDEPMGPDDDARDRFREFAKKQLG